MTVSNVRLVSCVMLVFGMNMLSGVMMVRGCLENADIG